MVVETAENGNTVKVIVEEPKEFPLEALWTLVPFPDTPKDLDPSIREGIMVDGACIEAHTFMEVWVNKLLSGNSSLASIPTYAL